MVDENISWIPMNIFTISLHLIIYLHSLFFLYSLHTKDVVFEALRPVLNFLRFMGVFPYTRDKPGEAKFKILSQSMIYSFVAFSALLVSKNKRKNKVFLKRKKKNSPQSYVVYIAIGRIHIVTSLEGRFEEAVIAYLFLVNILPVLIVPMIWTETGKFATVLNDWMDFEVLLILFLFFN